MITGVEWRRQLKGLSSAGLGVTGSGEGKAGLLAALTVDMLCAEMRKSMQTLGIPCSVPSML